MIIDSPSRLKNGECVRIKSLSIGDLNGFCKMLVSLGDGTRRFFHNPGFQIQNTGSYIKVYLSLLERLVVNAWLWKAFGSYFLGIIALNHLKNVVGFAYLMTNFDGLSRSATFGLVVRDDYQGEALGTNLTSHVIEAAKKLGVNVIRCTVVSDNARAIKLYRKFGFSIVGHHKAADVWRQRVSDTYTMTLRLRSLKSQPV